MNSLKAGAGGCVEELKLVIALRTLRCVSDTQIALESAPGTLLLLPSHLSRPRQLPFKM